MTISNKEDRVLGLKIDVDTYVGMKKGVPRLLEIMDELEIKGTFYLSLGPDASGRAIYQIIKNPLFLKKMLYTNAVTLYGFRTALYGTILPSPNIAMSFPELVKRIISSGHEVQFHAWDHRRWQDELSSKSSEWIRDWFEKGIRAFFILTGQKPSSFGAPAWLINDKVMKIVPDYCFDYLSCTRAKKPFIHEGAEVLEIPSDLPCLEETGPERFNGTIASLLRDNMMHVLPVHAEVEGGVWRQQFKKLIQYVKVREYRILPLYEIKKMLPREKLIVRKYSLNLLPGRSSPCAL